MKVNNYPKVVVFDLDGTLVDSGKDVASILNDMRIELGKTILPISSYIPWLSLGGLSLIKNGLEVSEVQAPELLNKFRLKYKNKPTQHDCLFPFVEETLIELVARGINLCICTNKPRMLAEKILNELGLMNKFDHMVACGDLATQKPHPDNLLKCLSLMGCSAEDSILIGDSAVDQKMANACQVSFGWYSGGYDDGVSQDQVEFSFKDFSQLISKLENRSLKNYVF